MEMYHGHTGPIYKVRCNPFWDDVDNPIFLTCSYDWTVRVWEARAGCTTQKLICRYKGKSKAEATSGIENEDQLRTQVNDICWSPKTSSVFGSVADDGRIEIWDLKRDNLAPLICYFDKDAEGNKIHTAKTAIRFAKTLPVVMTGDVAGRVHVYRTTGLEHD